MTLLNVNKVHNKTTVSLEQRITELEEFREQSLARISYLNHKIEELEQPIENVDSFSVRFNILLDRVVSLEKNNLRF